MNDMPNLREAQPNTPLVLAQTEKDSESKKFRSEMQKSKLYKWRLIDDRFLNSTLSDNTKNTLRRLSSSYSENGWNNILVKKDILHWSDFQANIAGPEYFDSSRLSDLLKPSSQMLKNIKEAVKYGFLNRNTIWSKFLGRFNFYNKAIDSRYISWKHLAKSGLVDIKNIHDESDGFDAVEVEYLQKDLLHSSNKSSRYPLDKKAHLLVQKLRGQENTQELSKQVKRVIGKKAEVK